MPCDHQWDVNFRCVRCGTTRKLADDGDARHSGKIHGERIEQRPDVSKSRQEEPGNPARVQSKRNRQQTKQTK